MTLNPLVPQQGTILQLVGMGIVLYSGRGCTQTLEPIQAAKVQRRSINGQLHDVSYSQFWKYQSQITCHDMMAPMLNNVHPGLTVTVYCISELIAQPGDTLWRSVVPGSEYTDTAGFVHFRPLLSMMVTGFSSAQDEWKAEVNWKLDLEEV